MIGFFFLNTCTIGNKLKPLPTLSIDKFIYDLYLILLQKVLNLLRSHNCLYFVLVLLYDVLHQRDPAHQLCDGMS